MLAIYIAVFCDFVKMLNTLSNCVHIIKLTALITSFLMMKIVIKFMKVSFQILAQFFSYSEYCINMC